MLEKGHIRLDRKMLNWRWYTEPNTMRLFLHLLFTANYEDREYLDFTVRRGQRVTSYAELSEELKMSVQSIRTAAKHLEKTGELTRSQHNKFAVFSLNNYDDFLLPTGNQQADNNQSTDNQQADNSQPTGNQQLCNKANKAKNANNAEKAEKANGELTVEEHAKLVQDFGYKNTEEYIKRLRDWRATKDVHIKSEYETIRKWLERDNVKKPENSDGFDPDKYSRFVNII